MGVSVLLALLLTVFSANQTDAYSPPPGRRVVALPLDAGRVFISWRYKESDGLICKYEVKRADSKTGPFTMAGIFKQGEGTCFIDSATTVGSTYFYYATTPTGISRILELKTRPDAQKCLNVPLPGNSLPQQIVLGDLNGDFLFDLVVLTRQRSSSAPVSRLAVEAFTVEGENIWRTELPPEDSAPVESLRLTAWDLDGDGRDEVIVRAKERETVLDPVTGQVISRDNSLKLTELEDSVYHLLTGEPDAGISTGKGLELYWDGGESRALAAEGKILNPQNRQVYALYSGTPVCAVDILGDWREELITLDENMIRIYTTTMLTNLRRPSPLDKLEYRFEIARGWMLTDIANAH